MLPMMLDVQSAPVAVIGGGFAAVMRLKALDDSRAGDVDVFAPEPDEELKARAGSRLHHRWPTEPDFESRRYKLVYVADIPEDQAEHYARLAHSAGALVNVHDIKRLCDFHMPARLVRGDLQVTVSTNGKAAGLARVLRDHLARTVFGPEWAAKVSAMAAARDQWRAGGASFQELVDRTDSFIADRRWLSARESHQHQGREG